MSRDRYRPEEYRDEEPWRNPPRRRRSLGRHEEEAPARTERDRERFGDLLSESEEELFYAESAPYIEERPPQRPRPGPKRPARPQRTRRGAPWLWFLAGCGLAILLLLIGAAVLLAATLRSITGTNPLPILGPNSSDYTQQSQQTVPIENLTRLSVTSQVGAIRVTTDPSLNTPQLTVVKHTRASSQAEADSEFRRIAVQLQPAPSSLTVTATLPANQGITGPHDAVDLSFVLPASVNQTDAPFQLNIELSVGDVQIQHLSGMLIVRDDSGNISVTDALLSDGSNLRTASGEVSFKGSLDTRSVGGKAPLFQMHSEVGRVDVTLPPSTMVILDANVNSGTISSAFPIQASVNVGSSSYYGPLIPGSKPTATLRLDVGSGTIDLHSA
jgi:hypothetical protein